MGYTNIGGLSFLNQAAYQTMFMESYDAATAKASPILAAYKDLYTEVKGTDPVCYDSYLSAAPGLRPMRASHPITGRAEQGMTLTKIPYKAEVTIGREQLEATNGAVLFQKTMDSLAMKASRFKANLIMDLIMQNGVCHDGQAYFSATHVFEGSGNQVNLAATAYAAGAGYVTELPNFLQIADSEGADMGQLPDVILFNPTIYPAGILYHNPNRVRFDYSGTATAGAVYTPQAKIAPILATANNTPSATEWYMFNSGVGAVKPFIVYETEKPKIEVTSQDGDLWKVNHELMIVVSWNGIASYGFWPLGYQANV